MLLCEKLNFNLNNWLKIIQNLRQKKVRPTNMGGLPVARETQKGFQEACFLAGSRLPLLANEWKATICE